MTVHPIIGVTQEITNKGGNCMLGKYWRHGVCFVLEGEWGYWSHTVWMRICQTSVVQTITMARNSEGCEQLVAWSNMGNEECKREKCWTGILSDDISWGSISSVVRKECKDLQVSKKNCGSSDKASDKRSTFKST